MINHLIKHLIYKTLIMLLMVSDLNKLNRRGAGLV